MRSTQASTSSLVQRKEAGRRATAVEPSLHSVQVKREERRRTHQRAEDRFRGVVADAVIITRGRKNSVCVENLSASGVMIRVPGELRIGEKIRLRFDGFEDLDGVVRWVRGGRAGIELPKDAIELLDEDSI